MSETTTDKIHPANVEPEGEGGQRHRDVDLEPLRIQALREVGALPVQPSEK